MRPEALWALPLAGLPVAVHFWGRVRARPTPFTAVDLLKEAAGVRFSTERLRRWVLLAVRTLMMVALILFLARPGFRGALGAGNVRGVLLLDASYSLQSSQSGESAFDRARGLARSLIENARKGDRWGVVLFSDQVEKSFSPDDDPRRILQNLEVCRPTFRGTSFSTGFNEAQKLLKGSGPVVLLSDLAAHGLSGDKITGAGFRGSVVAVEVVARCPNDGIAGLHLGGASPRMDVRGDPLGRTWSLQRGGRRVARGDVRWDKGRGGAFFSSGQGAAELSLNPDGLATDDNWFFVSPAQKPISVCLVNGAPSLSPVGDETYFIRPVLSGLSTVGVQIGVASPGELSTMNLSDTSVVILLNPPPLSSGAVDRLTAFVEKGGGLWVTAGDRGGYASLKDLLPLTPLSPRECDEGLEWSGGGTLNDLEGLLWNRVHVDRAWGGDVRTGARVVLRTAKTKMPLLTLLNRGSGRVALWGTTADRDWTNFPSKPAFPILVGSLLRWVSGNQGTETPTAYFVGEPIERSGDESHLLTVHRPDGHTDRMEWARGRWVYEKTDVPGFYDVRGGRNETVAVNVRAESEGDLTRATPELFQSWLGDVPLQWIPSQKARVEEIRNALQGRDLTSLVVWALFLLLLSETVLLLFPQNNPLIRPSGAKAPSGAEAPSGPPSPTEGGKKFH